MEVRDSLTALSAENRLSPSPSDTAPSQQPAPPPRDKTARGFGAGSGFGGRNAWGRGRGGGRELPRSPSLRGYKAPGGIMKCHPASTTADRRHFIYRLAFFVNYKSFFFLFSFSQMAESKCHLRSGALERWVVDGLVLLLVSLAFEMWLKTLDFLQCIYSKQIYDLRLQKNRGQTMDVGWKWTINGINTWHCFFIRKERFLVGVHTDDGEKIPTGLSWNGLSASISPVICLFLGTFSLEKISQTSKNTSLFADFYLKIRLWVRIIM